MPLLSASPNVGAAFHHVTRAAAMLVQVAQSVRRQVVDEDRRAALDRNPRVRTATKGVDPHIQDAQCRQVVHLHVRRSGLRRTDALVRAAPPPVVIHRHERLVAEPGLRLHCYSENIPQSLRTCETIAEVAGLTDESVCPTLMRQGLRFWGAGAMACQAGQSPASPQGRKRIAHGVSRVEPVVSPSSPGTGRKTLSLNRNVETPGAGAFACQPAFSRLLSDAFGLQAIGRIMSSWR